MVVACIRFILAAGLGMAWQSRHERAMERASEDAHAWLPGRNAMGWEWRRDLGSVFAVETASVVVWSIGNL